MLLRPVLNLLHRVKTRMADFVAEVFCPSECVRLIQDQASMRNVDSRIHSLRFDCCVFLFYSFSAVTFATKSAQRVVSLRFQCLDAIGVKADIARAWRACRSEAIDPGCVKTLEAIVGAQQKNRSHSLDESFMRGRPSLCTNLVPERPIKWFSHSQDP